MSHSLVASQLVSEFLKALRAPAESGIGGITSVRAALLRSVLFESTVSLLCKMELGFIGKEISLIYKRTSYKSEVTLQVSYTAKTNKSQSSTLPEWLLAVFNVPLPPSFSFLFLFYIAFRSDVYQQWQFVGISLHRTPLSKLRTYPRRCPEAGSFGCNVTRHGEREQKCSVLQGTRAKWL